MNKNNEDLDESFFACVNIDLLDEYQNKLLQGIKLTSEETHQYLYECNNLVKWLKDGTYAEMLYYEKLKLQAREKILHIQVNDFLTNETVEFTFDKEFYYYNYEIFNENIKFIKAQLKFIKEFKSDSKKISSLPTNQNLLYILDFALNIYDYYLKRTDYTMEKYDYLDENKQPKPLKAGIYDEEKEKVNEVHKEIHTLRKSYQGRTLPNKNKLLPI